MDEGETVTLCNDLCLRAPAALINARGTWQPVDRNRLHQRQTHVDRGTRLQRRPRARRLRLRRPAARASPVGTKLTPQRWSTPVRDYRTIDSRRVSTHGEACWHASGPDGEFAYTEVNVDDITFNASAKI